MSSTLTSADLHVTRSSTKVSNPPGGQSNIFFGASEPPRPGRRSQPQMSTIASQLSQASELYHAGVVSAEQRSMMKDNILSHEGNSKSRRDMIWEEKRNQFIQKKAQESVYGHSQPTRQIRADLDYGPPAPHSPLSKFVSHFDDPQYVASHNTRPSHSDNTRDYSYERHDSYAGEYNQRSSNPIVSSDAIRGYGRDSREAPYGAGDYSCGSSRSGRNNTAMNAGGHMVSNRGYTGSDYGGYGREEISRGIAPRRDANEDHSSVKVNQPAGGQSSIFFGQERSDYSTSSGQRSNSRGTSQTYGSNYNSGYGYGQDALYSQSDHSSSGYPPSYGRASEGVASHSQWRGTGVSGRPGRSAAQPPGGYSSLSFS